MAAPRRFTLTFALVIAAVLVPFAGLNALVDPYDLLGRNTIGIYVSNERLAKPMLISNGDYHTLIIGSSKVAAISPADFSNGDAFNASFGAALPEEMNWFLSRYAKKGQTVLLGLDFYMFNERAFLSVDRNPFADANAPSRLAYLIDKNILRMSLNAIVSRYWDNREPLVLWNGTRNQYGDWVSHNALSTYDYARVLKTLRENHYHDVHYSERRLAELRDLKGRMAARDVRLISFINPLNVEVRALIRELAEQEFQRFRRDMRSIFPDVYDLTGDELADRGYYYRHDPFHYKPAVGACFVRQILAGDRPVVAPQASDRCRNIAEGPH